MFSIGFLCFIVIIEFCNILIFCIYGNDSLFSEIVLVKFIYYLLIWSFEGVFCCEVFLLVCWCVVWYSYRGFVNYFFLWMYFVSIFLEYIVVLYNGIVEYLYVFFFLNDSEDV